VDDILDPGQHSSTIQHDDRPPLNVINKGGLPRTALPTLLSFHYYGSTMLAQRGGHPWHLWDHEFMGNGKEVFDVVTSRHSSVTQPYA